MKTLLTRTSPSSEKPSDKLPGRKYLWLATPATEQIGQDRNNASSSSQGVADARSRVGLRPRCHLVRLRDGRARPCSAAPRCVATSSGRGSGQHSIPHSQLPVFPDPPERCVDASRSRRSDWVSIASSCRPTRCGSNGTPICAPCLQVVREVECPGVLSPPGRSQARRHPHGFAHAGVWERGESRVRFAWLMSQFQPAESS